MAVNIELLKTEETKQFISNFGGFSYETSAKVLNKIYDMLVEQSAYTGGHGEPSMNPINVILVDHQNVADELSSGMPKTIVKTLSDFISECRERKDARRKI